MRIVVDLSDYQAGLNIDAVAGAVDGVWAKAGDWSWVNSHGWPGDDVHDAVVSRFNQLGRPVGSYFFPRPGWTSPGTQINAWADHMPMATTVVPMLDLEVPGTLSGGSLQAWIDEALAITTQRFGHQPVLYWNAAFCNAYGLSKPSTPHTLMVAEYHRGYQQASWANRAGWEDWAYSAYGGPGIPRGYSEGPRDVIWQWTSSAQIPGFSGLVDCSFIPDSVWPAITGGAGGQDLTQEEHDWLSFLHAVFSDDNRWGALWNAAGQTANIANQMNNVHRWTDVDGPGWKFPDGTPITTLPQFLHNLFMLQGVRDDGHGHKLDHLVTVTGEMTPTVAAHGGKLDHIVASGDATGPLVTNIQSMARNSGTNLANVVKVLDQHTTVLENILKASPGGGGSIDYAQLARALVTELLGRFGKTPTPPPVPSPPSPPTPPMPPTPPTPPTPPSPINPGNLSSGQALMRDHPAVQ